MELKLFDKNTTFFNNDLQKEIYVQQPLSFYKPSPKLLYYQLPSSIYRLKQSIQE